MLSPADACRFDIESCMLSVIYDIDRPPRQVFAHLSPEGPRQLEGADV